MRILCLSQRRDKHSDRMLIRIMRTPSGLISILEGMRRISIKLRWVRRRILKGPSRIARILQNSSGGPSLEASGPHQHFIGSQDESWSLHECMDEETTRIRAAAQCAIPSLSRINYCRGFSRQNRHSMKIALGTPHDHQKRKKYRPARIVALAPLRCGTPRRGTKNQKKNEKTKKNINETLLNVRIT